MLCVFSLEDQCVWWRNSVDCASHFAPRWTRMLAWNTENVYWWIFPFPGFSWFSYSYLSNRSSESELPSVEPYCFTLYRWRAAGKIDSWPKVHICHTCQTYATEVLFALNLSSAVHSLFASHFTDEEQQIKLICDLRYTSATPVSYTHLTLPTRPLV